MCKITVDKPFITIGNFYLHKKLTNAINYKKPLIKDIQEKDV